MTVHLITGARREDKWLTACGRWAEAAYASPGPGEVTCRACRGTHRYAVRVGRVGYKVER